MDQTYMKEKKILPLVLSMSLPMVLSMLVNALYNIVDSYFVARISENAMTAISLVYPIQLVVTAVAVGHGIGVNAVAAFFLGAQEKEKADDNVSLGLVLSILHGVILVFGCIAILRPFVSMFTKNSEVIDAAVSYGTIAFLFNLPNSIGIAYEKIFQAEGKMTVSMVAMLIGCITNIILDPMMIFGIGFPAMGIKGAALATGIGQALTLVVYLLVYFIKGSTFHIQFKKTIFNKNICKRIYGIGIPSMVNLSLPSIMITLLNGILAEFSDLYVLVLGIYYKLQTFIYLTVNGLVQGIRPLLGYNYGAGEHKRVKDIFYTSLTIAAIIMLIGTAVCWGFSEPLMHIFTANPETIQIGIQALRIISCGFLISSISVIACGTLEGLGNGNASLIISALRYIICIIPIAYLLSKILGASGVWHAFWVSECIASLVSIFLIRKTIHF